MFENKSKPLRVLLVDDEKGFVDVISKRMSRRNIDVTKAYSGREALQALRRTDFDAVVLDLKMEDMDGIEILKIFKNIVPDLPVIMLTGHGSEETARDGIGLGASDYLMKPCDFDELIAKIKDVVSFGR
ncbi:MAG: response regulator [Desulfobacterales bacterium]|jgi:DNA-binding response OmpR family regulator|nr:response regulator [Desulfobacterales bacterium]